MVPFPLKKFGVCVLGEFKIYRSKGRNKSLSDVVLGGDDSLHKLRVQTIPSFFRLVD